MAIQHKSIANAELHEPKDVSTATAGEVYTADGVGSGAWTAPESPDVVVVNSAADFPTPVSVGGVSTIRPEAKEYIINQSFSMSTPIAFPGVGLRATFKSTNRAALTYTGTDALWRDTDAEGDIEISGLTEWKAPNGDMFEIAAVTSGFSFQATSGPRFTDMVNIGTVNGNGASGFNIFFGTISDFDGGLVVQDTFFFEVNTCFVFGNNAVGSTIFTVNGTSTSGSVNFFTNTFLVGTNETIWDFNPTIEATVDSINLLGNLQEGGVNGVVLDAASLDLDSTKIFSRANDALLGDTTPDALITMTDNATTTTITTVDTPLVINGTYTEERVSLFTTTAAGRVTYIGAKDISVPLLATITAETASGGDKDVTFYFAKNGSVIPNSGVSNLVRLNVKGNTTVMWQDNVSTNDFYEVWVENNTDTVNVTVEDIKFLVN